jgi:dolichol-phosphate mannosyltransferase
MSDNDALDLTVLILAKNEAENLRELLPSIHRTLAGGGIAYDILVVVDQDDERTAAAAREHGARVTAQLASGYGSAFRHGAAQVRGRYVAAIDADLSHDPEVIQRLWEARDSAGLVIASRYVRGGRADMPLARHMLSRMLNWFIRHGLSLDVRDMSSGYRLYRREALQHATLQATHFDVLEEVLIQIVADGWTIREIPFDYRPRAHGRSHVRLLAFGWSFLVSFLRMWQLRNSAFSADYDERAYNSLIPLQRYWQRTRHRLIMGFQDRRCRTLDIGCGSSRIILGLPHVVGLDIQLKKLRRIQSRIPRLVQGTITSLPFAEGAFEAVICSQVIEHVPHELVNLAELNRVLALDGVLTIGTPDYGTWTWPVLEWAYGIVHPAGYVHEHINRYTAASLARELADAGFRITDTAYVGGGELIYRARKIAAATVPAARRGASVVVASEADVI